MLVSIEKINKCRSKTIVCFICIETVIFTNSDIWTTFSIENISREKADNIQITEIENRIELLCIWLLFLFLLDNN